VSRQEILSPSASRENGNRWRNARTRFPHTFSRASSSREQNRRVRTRGRAFTHKCVRDEEVRHSLTHCGPLQRGACVMRHPRHFSPPFYSSLPAVGRGGSLLRPLSGLTATLRRRYRLESLYANSPCGFCSPRKSSCKHARGATAGFTYANILLVRPWTRLWKSDLWISDFDTSRIYIRTRGEITFVCFVWVCVTRCSVETLHATNRWRLIKRLCINIVWMMLFLSLRLIKFTSDWDYQS